jgi:polysaccharide biosynthesis/export protein
MTIQELPAMNETRTMDQRPLIWALLALAIPINAAAQLSSPPRAELPTGQMTTPAPTTVATAPSGGSLIYPEDVLDVYVYDVPELSREYTVNAAGTITVPLLQKPVRAVGLSPDELARSLEESFRQSGRLSHPQITVSIMQSRRSVVTVEGAVRSPQAIPVIGPTSLLSVLSQSGGRSDDAGNTITVIRSEQTLRELAHEGAPASPTAKVEFKKLMDPSDPTSKFEVWPGDRVSVEHAGLFYVLGQVSRPGGYNLKSADEQVSILQALAIAGDVTPIAKTQRAMILRKEVKEPGGRKEIAINVKSILKGSSPDSMLQSEDILYIPASGGKRAIHSAGVIGSTVAAAAGGAIVYTRF